MPHPKNRLKLTGDTHLPDVNELFGDADEIEVAVVEIDAQPRVYADGWEGSSEAIPAETQSLPVPLMQAEQQVKRRVAATPWLAVGAALGFGFLVAKMLRN